VTTTPKHSHGTRRGIRTYKNWISEEQASQRMQQSLLDPEVTELDTEHLPSNRKKHNDETNTGPVGITGHRIHL
jgi:hypothetical protein